MVRDYKLYLLERHKYAGHPFTPEQQKTLSPKTVQCHVRALKAFSSWLYREGYTSDNRLMNVKLPKAPRTLIEPLTPDEVKKVLASIDRSTSSGARNFAIAVLMLDAGIREGEVASLTMGQLNLKKYCLRVMGKGKKERLVPIGDYARTVLWNYIDRERGKPQSSDIDNVFLTSRGKVTTENAIKLFFSRLARSSGIPRLHAHLCRHTFGINYLMNGGDIFSLKEILGHTTLEMVSQYLHFTSAQIAVQHHKYSPMDRLKMPSPGNSIQSLTE
jgi:integrase/recombinase XerC/integrase/recombinase XerD